MSTPRNTRRSVLAITAMLALAGVAGSASAQDRFWYLGAGLGYANSSAKVSRFAALAPTCSHCQASIDDEALSAGLFAGYQYNDFVAAEIAFAALPDSYSVRITDPNFPAPAFSEVDQDSQTFSLRGVFTLPLRVVSAHPLMEPLSVSAVLGATYWRSESTLTLDSTGFARGSRVRAESDQNGLDLTFGARVNYDVNDSVRVSGAWDRYRELGSSPRAYTGTVSNSRSVCTQNNLLNRPTPCFVPPAIVETVRSPVDVFSINVSYRFR